MRGPYRRAQNCGAQNRGNAPSPSLRSTSPRTRGEANRIPFSRRAMRPSYANTASPPGLTRWSMLTCGSESLSGNPIELPVRMDCRIKSGNDKAKKEQIKEAERRQTRDPTVRILRCGARYSVSALACRRSTTALAAATERYSSAPATRFLELGRGARSQRFEQPGSKDRALLSGRYPLLPVPVQRASRRPVIVPAGRIFPEPPGSGGDEPPPAGTALAPPAGVTGGRPLGERDSFPITRTVTGVNGKVPAS